MWWRGRSWGSPGYMCLSSCSRWIHLFHYLLISTCFSLPFQCLIVQPQGSFRALSISHTQTDLHTRTDKREANKRRPPQHFEYPFCLMLFINAFSVWHCLITTQKHFSCTKGWEKRETCVSVWELEEKREAAHGGERGELAHRRRRGGMKQQEEE